MAIKKWLARKGAVGGTARWAGKCYWQVKRRNPDATVDAVMKELVAVRYRKDAMTTPRLTLTEIISRGEMRGLAHLVTNILSIEASYQDNTMEDRFLFMEVIQEELEKLSIPTVEIYDPSKSAQFG